VLGSLLRSLLEDLLIAVVLLAASAILPFASFWLCRHSLGAQIVFWAGPWTTAVWVLLIIQVGGARFWRGRAHVLAWREAHGGYWGTAFRGTLWMFAGLLLSYGAEFAIVLLCQPSATVMHMLPCATYSPVLLALWRAARG
jgi:hypothetical protein